MKDLMEKPIKQSQVFGEVERLEKSVEVLLNHIETLKDRLSPVILEKPSPELSPPSPEAAPIMAPLAGRLKVLHERILTALDIVEYCIGNLEL